MAALHQTMLLLKEQDTVSDWNQRVCVFLSRCLSLSYSSRPLFLSCALYLFG